MTARLPHTYIDVLLILERDGKVLLGERAGTGYADGALHLPSGHLEPGEDVWAAMAREAAEEVGITIARDALHVAHVMHYRNAAEPGRIGWFFTAAAWTGEPVNNEPDKCAGIGWYPIHHLPTDTWPYTADGIGEYLAGRPFSTRGFPT